MNKIKDFFKGILIGIANVIPGFSGGTMAVILNVYERFISAFANILKTPIKVIKDVYALFLGVLGGILVSVVLIVRLLEKYPIQTMLFFIGLILGSIPSILKKGLKDKIKIKDLICFLICLLIIIIMPFFTEVSIANLNIDIKVLLVMLLMGIISSGAMVIPGVSGSLVLMSFGYYAFLMKHLNAIIGLIKNGVNESVILSILVVFVFALGVIIGIVFVSKIIEYLMKKIPQTVYFGILGLLLASPFAITYMIMFKDIDYKSGIENSNIASWIVGCFLLVFSSLASFYMAKKEKNEQNNKSNGDINVSKISD